MTELRSMTEMTKLSRQKVEETDSKILPDSENEFALVFTKTGGENLEMLEHAKTVFKNEGFTVTVFDEISKKEGKPLIMALKCTDRDRLNLEAENRKVIKELKPWKEIEALLQKELALEASKMPPNPKTLEKLERKIKKVKSKQAPLKGQKESTGEEAGEGKLHNRIVMYEKRRNFRKEKEEYYLRLKKQDPEFSTFEYHSELENIEKEVLTAGEKMNLIWCILKGINAGSVGAIPGEEKEALEGEAYVYYLLRKGIIQEVVPLHNDHQKAIV
jgi:hypothetical protein